MSRIKFTTQPAQASLIVTFTVGSNVMAVIPKHRKGGGAWHVVKLISIEHKRGQPVTATIQPLRKGAKYMQVPYSDIKPID